MSFSIKTREDYIQDYQDALVAIFGLDVSLDVESPQMQLGIFTADGFETLNLKGQLILQALSLDTSSGEALDLTGNLYGVPRIGATVNTAVIAKTGSGSLVDGESLIYQPTGDEFLVVGAVPGGAVVFTAIAVNPGRIEVIQGEVFVTSIFKPNISLVADDSSLSADAEQDQDYRLRLRNSFFINASSSTDSIVANILSFVDVRSAIIYQNTKDIPDADLGNLPSRQNAVMVSGGGGNKQAIADTIFRLKGMGINTYAYDPLVLGDNQFFSLDISGQAIQILINFVDPTPLEMEVTLLTTLGQSLSVEESDEMKQDISDFIFNTIVIGESVPKSTLLKPIQDKNDSRFLIDYDSFLMGRKGDTLENKNFEPGVFDVIFSIATGDITITIL